MYYMPFASVAQKNSPSSKLCADASNFDVCRWTLEEAETKNGKWNFQNGKKWQAAVSSPQVFLLRSENRSQLLFVDNF